MKAKERDRHGGAASATGRSRHIPSRPMVQEKHTHAKAKAKEHICMASLS